MKTSILITFITMTFFSFIPSTPDHRINHKASQDLAAQVVNALQQSSSSAYADLAPSVEDFKMIMADNAELYGGHLAEAQEVFVADYLMKTMPAVKESFEKILDNGRRRGIDWSNITLVSWETIDLVETPLTSAPFVIAIESGGKIVRIEIEKALYIGGHWHVSQYVKLI
jgi:hypothetical protein